MKLSSILKPLMCTAFVLLSAQNGLAQKSGTVDGGGANGLKSRIIESYKVKSSELPTKQFIQPLLELLKKSMSSEKEYNLERYYHALKSILEKHAWYIVPTNAEDIGSARNGIPFSTDQYAIQNGREVFIFEDKYLKAGLDSALDQEKIILHELFMGLKILMKMDGYTQCVYTGNFYNCNEEVDPALASLNPSALEHSEVRHLTEFISENRDKLNSATEETTFTYELIKQLALNNFHNKFIKTYRVGSSNILAGSIAKIIKSIELEKENNLYCNHWQSANNEELSALKLKWDSAPKGTIFSFKSKFQVRIIVEEMGDSLAFKLKNIQGKTLETVVRKKMDVIYGFNTNSKDLRNVLVNDNKTVEFYFEDKKPQEPKLGRKYKSVRLEINPETKELVSYRSSEVITTQYDKYASGGYSSSHRYFDKLNCTNQSIITYTK